MKELKDIIDKTSFNLPGLYLVLRYYLYQTSLTPLLDKSIFSLLFIGHAI